MKCILNLISDKQITNVHFMSFNSSFTGLSNILLVIIISNPLCAVYMLWSGTMHVRDLEISTCNIYTYQGTYC